MEKWTARGYIFLSCCHSQQDKTNNNLPKQARKFSNDVPSGTFIKPPQGGFFLSDSMVIG